MMCDKQLLEKFWKPEGQFYLLTSPENKTKGIGVEREKKDQSQIKLYFGWIYWVIKNLPAPPYLQRFSRWSRAITATEPHGKNA